jgi:large subunit ribosomal protein L5e
MPYIKIVKTKAYFKRYQVKFKRRRENKTDYQARKALVIQDKTKYNSPKYRLVVRFTNADIICQIAYATISSDKIMCAAYAHELSNYGVKGGYTNYAASYATGLLVARRVLKKLNLDTIYLGQEKPDGKNFMVKQVEGKNRPFYVLLDVGLRRTTTGARLFSALKGAVDGGLEIPHNNRRFVGYNSETDKFDPSVLRKHIFGQHVAEYMKQLKSDNPDKFSKHFSVYVKNNIGPDDIEKMWANAHKSIRQDPTHKPKPKKEIKEGTVQKRYHRKKLNLKQRKNRIKQILEAQQKTV